MGDLGSGLALTLSSQTLWTAVLLAAPVIGVTTLVGLGVSVLQVVTQIQEMSLTFVPKLVTAGVALLMFGPWMLRKLSQFASELWLSIPGMF